MESLGFPLKRHIPSSMCTAFSILIIQTPKGHATYVSTFNAVSRANIQTPSTILKTLSGLLCLRKSIAKIKHHDKKKKKQVREETVHSG